MSVAVATGDVPAMLWAIFAMVTMIVALDQLLWRPVVVWAQKFRVEEGGAQPAVSSWFLDWLRRSAVIAALRRTLHRLLPARDPKPHAPRPLTEPGQGSLAGLIPFVLLMGVLGYGVYRLTQLLAGVSAEQWLETTGAAGLTLGRVLLSTALGTLWSLPAGLAI